MPQGLVKHSNLRISAKHMALTIKVSLDYCTILCVKICILLMLQF